MWWPTPADKTPRFFQPCPGNNEYALEPGMIGIKDVAGGSELWYRPFRNNSGDAAPDPIRVLIPSDIPTHPELEDATKNGQAAYQHVNSTPTAGQTGTLISASNFVTGNTDKVEVKPEEFRLLQSVDVTTFTHRFSAHYKNLMFMCDTSNNLRVLNRNTLSEIAVYPTVGYGDGPMECSCDGRLAILRDIPNGVRIFDVSNLSVFTTISYTFTDGTINDLRYVSGKWWFYDNGVLYSRNDDATWSASSSVAITLTNLCRSFDIDIANNFVYILDFPETAGSGNVVKVNLSTGSIVATSPAIPTIAEYGRLRIINGRLYAFTRPSSGLNGCTVLSMSDCSIVKSTSSVSQFGTFFSVHDGKMYTFTGDTNSYVSNSVPSMPHKIDGSLEIDVYNSIIKSSNINGTYSIEDLLRSKLATDMLLPDHLGATIESIETSVPATADDKLYMISGGTSVYENHVVFNSVVLGPQIIPRKKGSTVYLPSTSTRYEYSGTAWVSVGILTLTQKTDLTDGGESTAHYHSADRARSNHTGTQAASTISDFDTEVSNNTDVAANTSSRHSHSNKTTLDNITAAYTTAEQSKLSGIEAGAEVNNISDANASLLTGGAATSVPHKHRPTLRAVSTTSEIELTDEQNVLHVTDARTGDVIITIDSAVLAIDGFEFSVLVDYDAAGSALLYSNTSTTLWRMNGDAVANRPLAYRFIIEGGFPHPFGTMPTWVAS